MSYIKKCNKCGQDYNSETYMSRKCSSCKKPHDPKQYYLLHRTEQIQRAIAWQAANKVRYLAQRKKNRQNKRDIRLAKKRHWRLTENGKGTCKFIIRNGKLIRIDE